MAIVSSQSNLYLHFSQSHRKKLSYVLKRLSTDVSLWFKKKHFGRMILLAARAF